MLSVPVRTSLSCLTKRHIRVIAVGSSTSRTVHNLYLNQSLHPSSLHFSPSLSSPQSLSSFHHKRDFTTEAPKDEQDEKAKARQNQVKATKYSLVALAAMMGGMAFFAISEWGPPHVDEQGREVMDEFSKYGTVKQYTLRTLNGLTNWNQAIKEPSRDVLLPDPLKAPYIQPPYTVIVEMNGILTHPDWTYKTGWRFKKRPFVDYFIQQCGPPNFELVVFTQDSGFTAHPVLDGIDPGGYIMYRLYRDSTSYVDGVRVKDLHRINRPLSRVIHIDWDAEACKLNSNNCLILKKWDGQDKDETLFDLANFIRAIASQEVEDVTEILHHYRQFEDPLKEFKERQRQLAEQEALIKESASKKTSLVGSVLKRSS